MSETDEELEKAAEAHGKRIYEIEGSSHSEVSERAGFIAGAEWQRKQIVQRLKREVCHGPVWYSRLIREIETGQVQPIVDTAGLSERVEPHKLDSVGSTPIPAICNTSMEELKAAEGDEREFLQKVEYKIFETHKRLVNERIKMEFSDGTGKLGKESTPTPATDSELIKQLNELALQCQKEPKPDHVCLIDHEETEALRQKLMRYAARHDTYKDKETDDK